MLNFGYSLLSRVVLSEHESAVSDYIKMLGFSRTENTAGVTEGQITKCNKMSVTHAMQKGLDSCTISRTFQISKRPASRHQPGLGRHYGLCLRGCALESSCLTPSGILLGASSPVSLCLGCWICKLGTWRKRHLPTRVSTW